ncbi:MAG: GNAT family N-acetyltransferase, partial [Treponema sp.]|nr:GNAT family N-acetyltransferase [Treponema sp.]
IAGRGVFRNFKNVIKLYPEVERKWHFYKERQMHLRLMDWYNALRESWGLETLPEEPEEYEDLVEEDFDFRLYNPAQDKDCVVQGVDAISREFEKSTEGELGKAFAALWNLRYAHEDESEEGFVCRTLTDDFAGCLLISPVPSCAKETVQLTSLFVKQNYRGLGIARTLVSFCMTHVRERGIRWFIITRIPQILEPMLVRFGFEKTDFGFVADLKN